jgi:hypothetical protein
VGLDNVNFLGAIAGAVSAMVLGALWYSPWMFGGRWQALIGRSDEELGNPAVAMLIAAIAFVVMGAGMSWIIPDDGSVPVGIMWGFLGFWGFALPAIVINSVFERRSWTLVTIYLGYLLIAMLAMAAFIAFLGG